MDWETPLQAPDTHRRKPLFATSQKKLFFWMKGLKEKSCERMMSSQKLGFANLGQMLEHWLWKTAT